ncbi:subclass B1 metallo-beta-lactamase [Aquimarina sp. 2201CG14-23]|uniref:subclass B1 metallo-beta-lactamase n=1 Tax=Aquimarina mycalae TaxID=3040073 RepID=UPI002477F6D6|nr:subclass B1 metallo-beta-lactamase [Aquimarina sp. 2201CG14-23]MDH7445927.1 subclass B1 metallo-beta-lactamase [Aquimarina sp. 2201CG14-23]
MSKSEKSNPKHNLKKTAKLLLIIVCFLCVASCKKTFDNEQIHISEDLQLIRLNEHSYIHTSYITLKSGSTFPCNGFVYLNKNEAYIFDSPASDIATTELISWIQKEQKATIKGVVYNHFHSDCTKGMYIFKENKIPTIASTKTKELLIKEKAPIPDQVFNEKIALQLHTKSIYNSFFGEAHTIDNIVSYFPEEKILFGGCMIKSIDAKKGNLADANLLEWSNTVAKIKKVYPDVEIVIPGHGKSGDQSLLDYTINLFNTEN